MLTLKLIQSSSPSLACVLWDFSDTGLPQIRAHLITDCSVIISLCFKSFGFQIIMYILEIFKSYVVAA